LRGFAALFDRLRYSAVLHFGYGMGEALALAATIDPRRIEPLALALCAFTDHEIRGHLDSDQQRTMIAVSTRNDLVGVVRTLVSAHPKPGTGS
jgi:hypothetical protein